MVVVWERWKGQNGRGGYRLDNETHPELNLPPKQIGHQVWLYEEDFLQSTEKSKTEYQDYNGHKKQRDAEFVQVFKKFF